MKTATITVRGRTAEIKYHVTEREGLAVAAVYWPDGEREVFYRGLYGDKTRWENRFMPDDLIVVLSEIFNKETPENLDIKWKGEQDG